MNFHFSFAAATLVMVGAAIGSIAQIPGIGGGFQAGYVFCMTTFFMVSAGTGDRHIADGMGIELRSDSCRWQACT